MSTDLSSPNATIISMEDDDMSDQDSVSSILVRSFSMCYSFVSLMMLFF